MKQLPALSEESPSTASLSPSAPFDVPQLLRGTWWEPKLPLLIWGFVVLGVALRLLRYTLRFPLWSDECWLSINFSERSYSDLMLPLKYDQVAPIGFLWIQQGMIKLFGFSEWSLRAFPMTTGIAAVVLFKHFAGRLLAGVPHLLAVAFFSVAYYPIRHCADAKPYASDILVSLILLTLAVEWWRSPQPLRWLCALIAFTPVALLLSFPATFVAGGISLGMLRRISAQRDRLTMSLWLTYNMALCGTFLWLFINCFTVHYDSSRDFMTSYWGESFPPLRNPFALFVWLIDTHTGELFAYPHGSELGGSSLTFICFVVGMWILHRRERQFVTDVFLGIFALALVAAILHRYPYGSNSRLVQYFAPVICLPAGFGAAILLSTLGTAKHRLVGSVCTIIAMYAFGTGILYRDLVNPRKHDWQTDHRDFAREFWPQHPESETICAFTDMKRQFFTGWYDASAYLCNQRIYSPSHQAGGYRGHWSPETVPTKPLRCVFYYNERSVRDQSAFDRWMGEMNPNYVLVSHETFQLSHTDDFPDYYETFQFFPKVTNDRKYRAEEIPITMSVEAGVIQQTSGTLPPKQ